MNFEAPHGLPWRGRGWAAPFVWLFARSDPMTCFLKALLSAVVLAMALPVAAQSPQAPAIAARSYLLLDLTASQVLAEKDVDSTVEPGSLTKLMVAYLVFDALKAGRVDLKQRMAVSERAWKMPGSRMFIDPKMSVPVEDLIKGMVVQSGNDATVALAEGVGGSVERFVELMNAQAEALGMKSTRYKNPEGTAEPGHASTARDLGVLAGRLIQDFPEFMAFYAIKQYRYEASPSTNSGNRNLLLFRDPTVDGLSTGYTNATGYALVATAKRDFPNVGGRRLLSIVLGAASENARANESQKLLNWGYTAYEAVKLFDAGQAVVVPGVWKGRDNTARLGRPEAIVVAVPAGQASRLQTQVTRPEPVVAPLQKGQAVGMLKISLGERPLLEVPLLALDGVEQAGVMGRAWDALRLWIK